MLTVEAVIFICQVFVTLEGKQCNGSLSFFFFKAAEEQLLSFFPRMLSRLKLIKYFLFHRGGATEPSQRQNTCTDLGPHEPARGPHSKKEELEELQQI